MTERITKNFTDPSKRWRKRNHTQKTNLLQALRHIPMLAEPVTEETAKIKLSIVVKHQDEFPLQAQRHIRIAGIVSTNACEFSYLQSLSVLESKIRETLFGYSIAYEAEGSKFGVRKRRGLNQTINTPEEAEVLVRCFPRLLSCKCNDSVMNHWSCQLRVPTVYWLIQPESLSFLPLFAKLGAELGIDREGNLLRLRPKLDVGEDEECDDSEDSSVGNVLKQLFSSTMFVPRNENFDRECLEILKRLHKMGMLRSSDSCHLVEWLLKTTHKNTVNNGSSGVTDYVEERLRLLIDWFPNSVPYERIYHLLVQNVLIPQHNSDDTPRRQQLVRDILKLGMVHCPYQLGCLFHGNMFEPLCRTLGAKSVHQIFDEQLSNVLTTNKRSKNSNSDSSSGNSSSVAIAPKNLVVAAASNDQIELSGLYILIRRDPTILLSSAVAAAAPTIPGKWLTYVG